MRQGQVAPKGKWTGDASGGVKAPAPLILPDPARNFARIAHRLRDLSRGHPMMEWLQCMAQLAQAQHVVATTLAPRAKPDQGAVERAVDVRLPPLAAEEHRRDPVWRDGLSLLLDTLDGQAMAAPRMPEPVRAIISNLRARDSDTIEALADGFLYRGLDAADAGAAVYVAAALQVYFTNSAADLPVASLRLLPQRGLCPCCGSTPVSGVVTASGQTPGSRYLYCSLCGTAWNHVRAVCIGCGESRSLFLQAIEGDPGTVKAETCKACRTYAKMLYQSSDTSVDPFADDLATLGLDLLVASAGWARQTPNPWVLIGQSGTE